MPPTRFGRGDRDVRGAAQQGDWNKLHGARRFTKVSAIELGVNYKFNPGAPAGPFSGAASVGEPVSPIAPVYKSKSPPIRSPYNWVGFYFGADGGYAWKGSTGTLTTRRELS